MLPEQPNVPLVPSLSQQEKYKFNFWETDLKKNFAPWFLIFCGVLIILGLGLANYLKHTNRVSEVEKSQTSEQLSFAEKTQMFTVAREYLIAHGPKGLEVELTFIKQVRNYALLKAVPTNMNGIDSVMIIMEKINNKWVAITLGTAFEEWYKKVPELFDK